MAARYRTMTTMLAWMACMTMPAWATVLPFDTITGAANYNAMPQAYGDYVSSTSDANGEYLEGNGWTPDIKVEYAASTTTVGGEEVGYLGWWGGATYRLGDEPNWGSWTYTFTPNAGYGVQVNSFEFNDYPGWPNSELTETLDWNLWGGSVGGVLLANAQSVMVTGGEILPVTTGASAYNGPVVLEINHVSGNMDGDIGLDSLNFDQVPKPASPRFPMLTHWAPAVPNTLPNPGYLQTVYDPAYHVNITRISDPTAFGFPNGSGQLQHQYSKIQAWNADMSKVLIGFTHVLNADDYSIYKDIATTGYYPMDGRWSNVDPDIRYFGYGNNLMKINIETNRVEAIHYFPGYEVTIGPWEGNISADDRYVVITNSAGDKASIYDIESDAVLATRAFAGAGIDWASVTPSGDYVAVSNNQSGHTELYDLDFNYLRDLTNDQQHADFAVDADGNEVFVQVIPLSMTRLDNGETTDLIRDATLCGWEHANPNISGHISGRNFDFPGWAIVSTPTLMCGNGNGCYTATDVFAIKLDDSQTIRHYGHSRASSQYASAATVSPDGQKIIFTTDWGYQGTGGGDLVAYAVEVVGNADFDSDGDVDGADFLAWQRGFGATSDATPQQGDANADFQVDAEDFAIWQAGFAGNEWNAIVYSFSVPEPDSFMLMILVSGLVAPLGRLHRVERA